MVESEDLKSIFCTGSAQSSLIGEYMSLRPKEAKREVTCLIGSPISQNSSNPSLTLRLFANTLGPFYARDARHRGESCGNNKRNRFNLVYIIGTVFAQKKLA